jgi:hypothetical protein
MIATLLAAAALAAAPAQAHPCRAPLPHGPTVPAPIVLWTSCGAFRLAPDGKVSRLPRHWLAKQGGGTGRRYGAHLDIRRTHSGGFLLLLRGRVVTAERSSLFRCFVEASLLRALATTVRAMRADVF